MTIGANSPKPERRTDAGDPLFHLRFREWTSACRWWIGLLPLFALPSCMAAATVTVDGSVGAGISQLRLGVTHTEVFWENGNALAVGRAKALLQPAMGLQNQSIMGWGANVPQASEGAPYNW